MRKELQEKLENAHYFVELHATSESHDGSIIRGLAEDLEDTCIMLLESGLNDQQLEELWNKTIRKAR